MIQLEKVQEFQLDKVADMARHIWSAYYIAIIPSDQINYMLDKFYALSSLKQQMDEGQIFYFIKDGNVLTGFVSISKKSDASYFIHKFYIYPEMHGKHIGSAAMKCICDMICSETASGSEISIRLTVNRQNFKAVNFYFRNLFRIESVEDFDIGNSYFMNDFVMLKKLKCV